MKKSTIKEIKERFDNDVERFSDLNTGQVSTIDAKLSLELITEAAKRAVPDANYLLDIGCGAGNYTLKMLEKLHGLHCTMIDLSKAMLNRAVERVSQHQVAGIELIQGDVRGVDLPENKYDIVLAGAVLHHLRDDEDWEITFQKVHRALKPGGCFWISDLVAQENDAINNMFWELYGDYLENEGGPEYKSKVFEYVKKEDSPRPMTYQLDLMKKIGFGQIEVLHKNSCFGAFGGIK